MQTQQAPEKALELRLLLVDEDEGTAAELRGILESPPPLSIGLTWVPALAEALRVIGETKPDAVLIDLRGCGADVDEALWAIEYGFPCAVIVLTGDDSRDTWTRSIAAGALNCLQKQYYLNINNREALMHSIANAMYLHTLHPALKCKTMSR